jgi:hypothetical protein
VEKTVPEGIFHAAGTVKLGLPTGNNANENLFRLEFDRASSTLTRKNPSVDELEKQYALRVINCINLSHTPRDNAKRFSIPNFRGRFVI